MKPTTRSEESTAKPSPQLYLSFELGRKEWKLAFAAEAGQKARLRTISAGDLTALEREIELARQRFGLAAGCGVASCYEAGRDGFWLHRYLVSQGILNQVVDSSSIEVNRRSRRAKTDRLDALKLLGMLIRYERGERKVWSVVRVPSVQEEDNRQPARELDTLKQERTRHRNRIGSLLATVGVSSKVGRQFLKELEAVRQWDGQPLPAGLLARLHREWERLEGVQQQIRVLEKQREEASQVQTPTVTEKTAQQLLRLRGIGGNSAWLYATEFFGWRQFRNRREVGSLAGLTPMPYHSGDSTHEQGISKSGNGRLRRMCIEIAWAWLRFQPHSTLSLWFQQRYGPGNRRNRRVGIVALARKLLVSLWRYLETGVPPEGALLKA